MVIDGNVVSGILLIRIFSYDDCPCSWCSCAVSEMEADHLWRAASAQFARNASGEVNAFTVGTSFDRSKVFYGLELKNLSKNPDIQFPIIYRGQ